MERYYLRSRKEFSGKQDVSCSTKLPELCNNNASPHMPFIGWGVFCQCWWWVGRCPLPPPHNSHGWGISVTGMCPTECNEGFDKDAARAWVKAQQCPSESFQGFCDVKHSWVASALTKWVLVPYSPDFLLDVYRLHPFLLPAISTCRAAEGDEIHSPLSSFRNLSHLPCWVGTRAVGWEIFL